MIIIINNNNKLIVILILIFNKFFETWQIMVKNLSYGSICRHLGRGELSGFLGSEIIIVISNLTNKLNKS